MNFFRSLALLVIFCAPGAVAAEPALITCAHSHNDYRQKRPLFDALDCGF
jgi:hypothetical protein